MALPEFVKLNTGAQVPAVGFGTWQAAPKEVEAAVEVALRNGYKHIDCAAVYRNETEVGMGIKNSGAKREDLFITTKLWNTHHGEGDVEEALDRSLQNLGTDYVDLYLMHWPCAFAKTGKFIPLDQNGVISLSDTHFTTTWKAMEKLLKTGKVKAIGVSNFTERKLQELLEVAEIVPAVNQIEAHPYIQQAGLKAFCEAKGILIQAYSPLGNNQSGMPRTVDDAIVGDISQSLGIDRGQLLVSWAVQRGTVALPKSVTEARILSNRKVVELPKDAFEKLNALNRHQRFNDPSRRWGYDIFDEVGGEDVKKTAREFGPQNLKQYTF